MYVCMPIFRSQKYGTTRVSEFTIFSRNHRAVYNI